MQESNWFNRYFINSNIYSLLVIYAIIISFLIIKSIQLSTLQQTLIGFISGAFVWSLIEYFVHRFLFHGERRNLTLQKFQFFMHGYHHTRPRDPQRLVLPFILTLPITIGLYFLLTDMMPSYGHAACAGVLFGYIGYDVSHYVIHRAQPKTRFGKFRRDHHYHHHFKDQTKCFGVTLPIWDYVFGTVRSRKERKLNNSVINDQ